ncbi:penicillin-binding transpeptidase domain-containing protein [Isoptericola aurantiacus]|uniref:penicillin-binding transpeptidase domain-containing protein n=1 Tax=Isoptericola aurantiacus TaxID=3377839 RepID=UPI00383B2B0D
MRRRTTLALAALLTPAVLAAAGCTGPDRPPASETADALASALAAGDVSAFTLVTTTSAIPQQHLEEVTAPLVAAAEQAGLEPTVQVTDVTESPEAEGEEPTADVTLAWSWPLSAEHTWEYTTTTELAWAAPPEDSDESGEWKVLWQPDLVAPDLAAGERLEIAAAEPDRGDLLDVHGDPLVTERDVWRIGIDKTYLKPSQYEAQARELAKLVGLDPAEYAGRVEAAGDKAYVLAITIRQDHKTSGVDFTADDARGITGVNVLADTMELAPTSSFARPVLGRSGDATAEIIEDSDGEIVAGDVVGLSGLQQEYDGELRGTAGLTVDVVSRDDEVLREAYRVDPVDGADVATAFDPDLQVLAEEVLADVEPASAIVAIRPSTGDVLAAASGPGSEGWSTATLGQYPPGSTFKVAGALALMRSGVFPEDTVDCPATRTVDGRTYSNVPGYPASATGQVSFRTAFAHSCNTAFIGAGGDLAPGSLADAAADLGLVAEPATGTASFLGEVPPSDDGATARAETMIGQGAVLASPLGMATVAASVAAGRKVEPRIVREVVPADGSPAGDAGDAGTDDDASTAPSPEASEASEASGASGAPSSEPSDDAASAQASAGTDKGLTKTEAADLRDLMGAVVSEGSASALADIPGVVGAKTGTAQYGDGSRQHVWMLAIEDDLAVAVFVEDGEYGSTTAGPLMGAFLSGI